MRASIYIPRVKCLDARRLSLSPVVKRGIPEMSNISRNSGSRPGAPHPFLVDLSVNPPFGVVCSDGGRTRRVGIDCDALKLSPLGKPAAVTGVLGPNPTAGTFDG